MELSHLLVYIFTFVLILAVEMPILAGLGYRSRRYYLLYGLTVNSLSALGVIALFRFTDLGGCYDSCFNTHGYSLFAGVVFVIAIEGLPLALSEDLPWYSCLLLVVGLNVLSSVVVLVSWFALAVITGA